MLAKMVAIFCDDSGHEKGETRMEFKGILQGIEVEPPSLCSNCSRLLIYGLVMLVNCPYNPKQPCKLCLTPCYRGEYRPFIKKVMRRSGLKLIRSGRLDLMFKYFF